MKSLVIIIFSFVFVFQVVAQKSQTRQLQQLENSLQVDFYELQKARTNQERDSIAARIVKKMETALAFDSAYYYPFDSLKYVGKIISDDGLVRVYTWNFQYLRKTINCYKYYGFVQHVESNSGEIATYRLHDKASLYYNAAQSEFTASNWYGALYYDIVDAGNRRNPIYTLIGWDGNDMFTTIKMIDVLQFAENGEPKFGAPVFETRKGIMKRIVFEYSYRARMMLRYDERLKMIVFDHLSPSEPKYKGHYQYYGPDFSYDGIRFEKDRWVYVADIDVRNPKDDTPPRDIQRITPVDDK